MTTSATTTVKIKSIGTIEFTAQHIAELKEWITDCQWGEEVDVDTLTPASIVLGCHRNLEGGIMEFDFSTPITVIA